VRDVREALMVARNSDGKAVRRPVSPHLDVYQWSLSMALSILHRASGIALAAGSLVLVWWLVAAARGAAPYAFVQGFLGSIFGWIVLFGWTVALWFHFCSGIRHLVWDAGKGFEKAEYTQSGWIVVIATGVLSVLTLVLAVAVR
jgi:succinate dehydrogenase / fumarate reductase cytochrome b subunit